MISNIHDHLKNKLNKISLEHSDKISYFENILRSLLFLMPGRFNENELISESLRSLVGLIGDYFDTSWVKNSIQYGRGESAFKLETVSNGQFDDLSKDVKENLLYTYRKLPKSMFNNLTLHSILSFFDSTELFFEILSTTISNYFEGGMNLWKIHSIFQEHSLVSLSIPMMNPE